MNFFRALVTCIHGIDFGWTDRANLHVGSRILIFAVVSFLFSIATFLIGRFASLVGGGVCLR
jgi:hypothetical protein